MSNDRATLTDAELAAWRQKAEKATRGEWWPAPHENAVMSRYGRVAGCGLLKAQQGCDDATYLAACSPDRLLALLDEVARLRDAERTAFRRGETSGRAGVALELHDLNVEAWHQLMELWHREANHDAE